MIAQKLNKGNFFIKKDQNLEYFNWFQSNFNWINQSIDRFEQCLPEMNDDQNIYILCYAARTRARAAKRWWVGEFEEQESQSKTNFVIC